MSRRPKTKSPPFIMVTKWLVETAAWRDLDPVARTLYLELRQRYNGHNNGSIGLGCREAADAINVGRNVANRAFGSLKEHGFISEAVPSSFNTNGRRATEWLLTEVPDSRTGQAATKNFAKWTPTNSFPSPAGGTLSPAGGTQRQKTEPKNPLRPAGGTQKGETPVFASHGRDTSRSTTPGSRANGTR